MPLPLNPAAEVAGGSAIALPELCSGELKRDVSSIH